MTDQTAIDPHAIEAERDDLRIALGRAEAETAAMVRDRDEVIRERDKARRERDSLARRLSIRFGELEEARAARRQAEDERDVARHLVDVRTAALARHTERLTAALRVVDAAHAWRDHHGTTLDLAALLDDLRAALDAYDAAPHAPAERPDSTAGHPRGDDAATEAHRGAQLFAALDAWAQDWHRYIAAGAHPAQPADIALLAAYNAHRPDADAEGDEPCADPVCPTLLPEQSCDTCGRYVDWPRLAATPTPGSGGDHAQGQAEALAPWIRRAVGDPGSIAGDRRGPSWPEGSEGWAEEQETVVAWTTRAVLRVIAHGGRPVCERCDEVIRVDDAYDPPLPGIGLWEHRGHCPGEPTPAEIAEHGPTVTAILDDVRAGRDATLAQIERDAAVLDATLRAGDVDDHMTPAYPATSPTLGEYHWGRAWAPTQDEATCPCPKAPCGYVVRTAARTGCEYHGPTTTMRGGHTADRCPANNPANTEG
ncbi:hypothetical protein [Micromonospora haikouensis]|uniref:hypothetical protein n=1 Tax=Micromonospora haikouensis TaxID=686309 RepID=UPI003D76196C